MTNETETMQENNQDNNQTPLEEVEQQDNIQTPSEDDQQQDNNQNEHIPTDKQVIECVEAIITTRNKTKNGLPPTNDRKQALKPKVVSIAEGQYLHIKLLDGVKTCAIQFI